METIEEELTIVSEKKKTENIKKVGSEKSKELEIDRSEDLETEVQ